MRFDFILKQVLLLVMLQIFTILDACSLDNLSLGKQKQNSTERSFYTSEEIGDLIGKAYAMMGYGHVFLQRSQLTDAENNFSTALRAFIEGKMSLVKHLQ